jgi:hypothetical protein
VAGEAVRYFVARGSRGRFHVESPYFIFLFVCVLALVFRRAAASAADTAGGPREPDSRWTVGACVVIALVLYWPAISLGLLSDDFALLAIARRGEALVVREIFWRPLPIALYAAGDWLGGPVLLHLLNVTLHGVNGWLTARLARALGLGPGAALAAAALFLVFPAGVEPVAWVSGLPDLLMTTVLLTAIEAWGAPWPLRFRVPAVLVLSLIALVTKETSIALPLLGLLVWAKRRPLRENAVIAGALAVAVAAFAAWWVTQSALPDDYAQMPSRGLIKDLLARSYGGLGAPYTVASAYGLATSLAAGVLFPFLLAANAAAWRTDRAAFTRSLRMALWPLAAVLPVYRYLYIAADLQGSRYLYLPCVGWSILVVGLVETAAARAGLQRRARIVALVLVVAAHAVALRLHLEPWREAAGLRDVTLRSAVQVMAARGCGPESTFTVTDSWRGAFVFRNGFPEALQRLGPPSGPRACRLRWEAGTFVED